MNKELNLYDGEWDVISNIFSKAIKEKNLSEEQIDNMIKLNKNDESDVKLFNEDKFSDIYSIGEQFAKTLDIKTSEDIKSLLSK